jgi:type IV pilus assembly protein PilN
MPRINLLPWREQQRKERKLGFVVGLGVGTVAALIAAGAGYVWFSSLIDGQRQRNATLKTEIVMLDRQIEEINNLEAQKQQFISRMQIIEKLQRSRPEIVHVFDTVVHTIPDGTYLTEMTQTGRRLKFHGVAQSSTRVSSFMRNIEASQWLSHAELEVVETKKDNTFGSDFTLFADQTQVAADDDAGAGKAGAKAGAKGAAAKPKSPVKGATP